MRVVVLQKEEAVGQIDYQGVHIAQVGQTTVIPRGPQGTPVPFGYKLSPAGFLPEDQVRLIAGELSQNKSAGELESGLTWCKRESPDI